MRSPGRRLADSGVVPAANGYATPSGIQSPHVTASPPVAPAGTLLFVRDPAVTRGAVVAAGGATILSVGAKPGEAFRVRPWEVSSEVFPLLDRGEYAEAKRLLVEAVREYPDEGVHLYNLACAETQLGESDAALDHLLHAVELEDRFAEYAQDDEDLASLRDDPRFPPAPEP